MHKLQLFTCEDPLLQKLLEVISAQINDPVYRKRQLDLKRPEQARNIFLECEGVILMNHSKLKFNIGACWVTDCYTFTRLLISNSEDQELIFKAEVGLY